MPHNNIPSRNDEKIANSSSRNADELMKQLYNSQSKGVAETMKRISETLTNSTPSVKVK